MSLREQWEANAERWLRWARTPGHDSYDQFHGRAFLELLPPPKRLTVDLGSGEGRLGRDLVALGHNVVALDASPTLTRACRDHEVRLPVVLADAQSSPFRDGCADLVVAFMSLHDIDRFDVAIADTNRLLTPDGRLCLAIVHPINSAGSFEGPSGGEAPFVIRGSYFSDHAYHDEVELNGLAMTFHSQHRPLEVYSRALEEAGFLVEAIREVGVDDATNKWSRVPLFLHLRVRRSP